LVLNWIKKWHKFIFDLFYPEISCRWQTNARKWTFFQLPTSSLTLVRWHFSPRKLIIKPSFLSFLSVLLSLSLQALPKYLNVSAPSSLQTTQLHPSTAIMVDQYYKSKKASGLTGKNRRRSYTTTSAPPAPPPQSKVVSAFQNHGTPTFSFSTDPSTPLLAASASSALSRIESQVTPGTTPTGEEDDDNISFEFGPLRTALPSPPTNSAAVAAELFAAPWAIDRYHETEEKIHRRGVRGRVRDKRKN